MNTQPAPTVGQVVSIDGIEYFVTHVTVEGNNRKYNGGDTPEGMRIRRAQIDLSPVEEVKARHASLTALLNGRCEPEALRSNPEALSNTRR